MICLQDWNYNTLLFARRKKEYTNNRDYFGCCSGQLIPQLISQLPGISPEDSHHTSVILADEDLLVPVLTSLP
jgi:hypothetical protein